MLPPLRSRRELVASWSRSRHAYAQIVIPVIATVVRTFRVTFVSEFIVTSSVMLDTFQHRLH